MTNIQIHDCSAFSNAECKELFQQIRDELISYNNSIIAGLSKSSVLLSLTDKEDIVGGLFGKISWDWLHIELLWIEESYRNSDYGTQLILKAEAIAQKADCIGVHLESSTFQAPGFYKKLGYSIFAELENKPRKQTQIFFKKEF
ncbi:GNAT family N-acetyltransferase [Desulfosediminicola flagellatus]|uniref:GNAT family N-acetyltransferase n=1 Tax=Desulfosediminicola flagellatus TaxID=2569541 RepID=UPI0010AD9523|nr:GNAT family N-acetyltransferase [Desulfosediminicola flagellatus]